ncbi:MAG: TRAP transporter small permease [Spirochaetaceae bacterium]|nr:TRAP transporter small permease [Spirochaetaceae bacterium]MDT8297519.1 TRAP transporter small permease [Spirochaetaceae bacterium]
MASIPRRVGGFLLDLIEIYIPSVSFAMMFISFIIQIFSRYVLNDPQVWTYELTIFGFIWTALLGALYAKRLSSHVKFTLLYDSYKPRTQIWVRVAGNSLICIAFIIGFWPALDYVLFMGFKKSTILGISYDIAFFPFIIFIAVMIGRFAVDVWKDMRLLTHRDEADL